jgi:RNA-directed DNA polymerase
VGRKDGAKLRVDEQEPDRRRSHLKRAGMILQSFCDQGVELYGNLKLRINDGKSTVASVFRRNFLGYAFWAAPGGVIKRRASRKAIKALKQRIREKTPRNGGKSVKRVIEELRSYILGWRAYYRYADTPKVFADLDGWMRHRVRAIQLKHWRRKAAIERNLRALGANQTVIATVAGNAHCWWRNSDGLLKTVLNKEWFGRLDMPRLSRP